MPPFNPAEKLNLFGHYFGVEFVHEGHTYIQAISPFEFASCLRLTDKLRHKLSLPAHTFCLDTAIPGMMSARIFDQMHKQCIHIHLSNLEIMEPHQCVLLQRASKHSSMAWWAFAYPPMNAGLLLTRTIWNSWQFSDLLKSWHHFPAQH